MRKQNTVRKEGKTSMASKAAKGVAKAAAPKGGKLVKPKNGVQYTQAEFVECLRVCCDFDSRKTAKEVFENFVTMLQAGLKKGYKIPLPGIGKIQVRHSKARMGRNPATGELIHISARKRVRLTPSKALKEAVL